MQKNFIIDVWQGPNRSSRSQMSFNIGALKNFTIFAGKHLCWSLSFIKLKALRPETLLKRDSNIGWKKYARMLLQCRGNVLMFQSRCFPPVTCTFWINIQKIAWRGLQKGLIMFHLSKKIVVLLSQVCNYRGKGGRSPLICFRNRRKCPD